MMITEMSAGEIELVAGGEVVCTIPGSGTFTFANGSQLHYTSQTVHSNGSITLNLQGGGHFTFPPPSDPRMVALVVSTCLN